MPGRVASNDKSWSRLTIECSAADGENRGCQRWLYPPFRTERGRVGHPRMGATTRESQQQVPRAIEPRFGMTRVNSRVVLRGAEAPLFHRGTWATTLTTSSRFLRLRLS